jgi:hypothetical protein
LEQNFRRIRTPIATKRNESLTPLSSAIEIRYSKKSGSFDHPEFVKGAEIHHDLHSPSQQQLAVTTDPEQVIGNGDGIDIDGILGVDFEEDEDDTRLVDGCFWLAGLQCDITQNVVVAR